MSTLPWIQHLVIVPVLLPLIVGALLIPINQTRYGLKFALGIGSGLLLWMVSVALLLMADGEHWPAGIG
ncbi:MAG: cation:proton antiporter, partial [Burkholderiaceae bacterium]|nr:cation:proton antiporter [Burkholderiaceae bacterium]